jgi:hypothetical protein
VEAAVGERRSKQPRHRRRRYAPAGVIESRRAPFDTLS